MGSDGGVPKRRGTDPPSGRPQYQVLIRVRTLPTEGGVRYRSGWPHPSPASVPQERYGDEETRRVVAAWRRMETGSVHSETVGTHPLQVQRSSFFIEGIPCPLPAGLGLGSPSWDPLGPNRSAPLVRFWPGGGAIATPPPRDVLAIPRRH